MKELTKHFSEIKNLITEARNKAIQSVNSELINLYWQVGEYVSKKLKQAEWGDGIVTQLADYLKTQEPDLKGFNKRGIYRMVQFYETYSDKHFVSLLVTQMQVPEKKHSEFVSPLVTQISWTNHLIILSSCKTIEEKVFYLIMCKKERWSKRDLERQIKASTFERTMIANEKMPTLIKQYPKELSNVFRDTYVLEFLKLPETHSESDLQKAILQNLKNFIIELGGDFAFIGEEYKLQVGNQDFRVDLLFYHRELNCLVAFELKTEIFTPEHLGQINFYLEALDRDVKKSHENPSIGILLCKGKDDVVVEYALSRSLNPAMIADYKTKLPDKKLLHDKWQELLEISEKGEEE